MRAYSARYLHSEIELLHFRARYYDPELGEFISRDPLGYVDGMSLYRGYFVPEGMDPGGLLLAGFDERQPWTGPQWHHTVPNSWEDKIAKLYKDELKKLGLSEKGQPNSAKTPRVW